MSFEESLMRNLVTMMMTLGGNAGKFDGDDDDDLDGNENLF